MLTKSQLSEINRRKALQLHASGRAHKFVLGSMLAVKAGKKGGKSTVKEKGTGFMSKIGRIGGRAKRGDK